MYKYLKNHKNDNHWISNDVWRKLKYGNFKPGRNNFHNNQDMNRPRDPMQRYNDIIKKYSHTGMIKSANKIPIIKPAIPNEHGMKRSDGFDRNRSQHSEWKSLDANVKRKLKKYGFSKSSEVNPAFISYITKKIEKKKLKKGIKNTL